MQSDYKLIRQVIEGLSMMNNKFMNLMLDDNVSAAQIMLRVILKDDKIKVKNVRIQRFIQNIYGHSAQLDILAEDGFGRYFNVEVQRSDEGASVRRARFYSSVLDTQFLQTNRDYNELPDSYIIFIGRLQVQVEQNLSSNYISGIHLIKKSVEQFIRSVVA